MLLVMPRFAGVLFRLLSCAAVTRARIFMLGFPALSINKRTVQSDSSQFSSQRVGRLLNAVRTVDPPPPIHIETTPFILNDRSAWLSADSR